VDARALGDFNFAKIFVKASYDIKFSLMTICMKEV
jgi:hypothetical protein